MDDSMYEKNRLLQRKLDNLIKQAQANERKQQLYESFGFDIIGVDTPAQLSELLLCQMSSRFQLVDVVLCLVDHHQDTEHLFFNPNEEAHLYYTNRLLILDTETDANLIQLLPDHPLLGNPVLKKYRWMILNLESCAQVKSAALLPLTRSGRIIGTLLLLSHDINRYQEGVGTLFLQKLSAMTAVAIENCLNQQRIKEISYQDTLTQAYNRRYFDLRLKEEIARCMRCDDDLICMFLDVDHFKKINDTYGHQTGDRVLKHMVNLIKEQVRTCDIVARYGGEEFVVALPMTTLQAAHDIAERLRQTICSATLNFQDKPLKFSISIGIACLQSLITIQPQDIEILSAALLDKADQALYAAKSGGRNQVAVYGKRQVSVNRAQSMQKQL
ncbi:sensor domain-containing diguanylate cyclase [Nitrosomonas sp. JL21]|uniref:GGDEF domain-containing protein n=1 Tax=Nitrosomonas sp. JL21 TaxID=153949 RepID=UPI0013707252|nr:sensor domain-containing diguanylate cyclase [Nitrosomonas sp. JL21]MBL8497288.1 sensor domain-containing diguanylate cyclase [Nitrosomonas sp.]MXS77157.1 sensor domain-containing diguanylate cyclase [Nitrosomonas sp. JL21]